MLNTLCNELGPFKGIIGYSQGAMMTNLYLHSNPVNDFSFAVTYCGYIPTTHLNLVWRRFLDQYSYNNFTYQTLVDNCFNDTDFDHANQVRIIRENSMNNLLYMTVDFSFENFSTQLYNLELNGRSLNDLSNSVSNININNYNFPDISHIIYYGVNDELIDPSKTIFSGQFYTNPIIISDPNGVHSPPYELSTEYLRIRNDIISWV